MKKILCILLVAVCFICPYKFEFAHANVGDVLNIANGNFENFTREPSSFGAPKYKPNDWTIEESVPLSNLVNKETSVFYEGSSCLLVKNSGIDLALIGSSVSVKGGTNYRLGYRIKNGEESGVNAHITIRSYDENNNLIKESKSKIFKSTDDWTDVFIENTLPENAKIIKPVINVESAPFQQSGTSKVCYVDAVYAYEIEAQIFTVKDGASLRLVKETPGIRFYAQIDKKVFDQYKTKYQSVSAGMLITPTENLKDLSDFTVKELNSKNILYVQITADKWANQSSFEIDQVYGYYCALVNILPQNICRKFSARAYISYQDKGQTYYVYSNYDQLVNSRSVNEVAILAKQELENYDKKQQDIINYYAEYNS